MPLTKRSPSPFWVLWTFPRRLLSTKKETNFRQTTKWNGSMCFPSSYLTSCKLLWKIWLNLRSNWQILWLRWVTSPLMGKLLSSNARYVFILILFVRVYSQSLYFVVGPTALLYDSVDWWRRIRAWRDSPRCEWFEKCCLFSIMLSETIFGQPISRRDPYHGIFISFRPWQRHGLPNGFRFSIVANPETMAGHVG